MTFTRCEMGQPQCRKKALYIVELIRSMALSDTLDAANSHKQTMLCCEHDKDLLVKRMDGAMYTLTDLEGKAVYRPGIDEIKTKKDGTAYIKCYLSNDVHIAALGYYKELTGEFGGFPIHKAIAMVMSHYRRFVVTL